MSAELDTLGIEMFNNQVPEAWASKGFLSLMPLSSWINDFNARKVFLKEWFDGGTPIVFWVSGFSFPQAFLTGALQNYARKYKIAIDIISMQLEVSDEVPIAEVKQVKEKPARGSTSTAAAGAGTSTSSSRAGRRSSTRSCPCLTSSPRRIARRNRAHTIARSTRFSRA